MSALQMMDTLVQAERLLQQADSIQKARQQNANTALKLLETCLVTDLSSHRNMIKNDESLIRKTILY